MREYQAILRSASNYARPCSSARTTLGVYDKLLSQWLWLLAVYFSENKKSPSLNDTRSKFLSVFDNLSLFIGVTHPSFLCLPLVRYIAGRIYLVTNRWLFSGKSVRLSLPGLAQALITFSTYTLPTGNPSYLSNFVLFFCHDAPTVLFSSASGRRWDCKLVLQNEKFISISCVFSHRSEQREHAESRGVFFTKQQY